VDGGVDVGDGDVGLADGVDPAEAGVVDGVDPADVGPGGTSESDESGGQYAGD